MKYLGKGSLRRMNFGIPLYRRTELRTFLECLNSFLAFSWWLFKLQAEPKIRRCTWMSIFFSSDFQILVLILIASIVGVLTMGALYSQGTMMRWTLHYLIFTPLNCHQWAHSSRYSAFHWMKLNNSLLIYFKLTFIANFYLSSSF